MLDSGTWASGCNYWASHAGCHMWNEWNAAAVADDMEKLAAVGMEYLRVFPLWSDFQPLTVLYGAGGVPREIAWKRDEPLPEDGLTLDPVMLERFRFLADCAGKHHIKLIVALLTGWMSGELFVPPALTGRNLFTDPEALYRECRFIAEFIAEFKNHPAIVMWEPGNECNCMAQAANRAEARWWLSAITAAIRAADGSRPVGAGMHGLRPAERGAVNTVFPWVISDVGAMCDYLTTHPYPAFTEFAATDGLGSPKSVTHAAAESRYFGDLGKKPCFAEEVGSLAPSNGGEAQVARYVRGMLPELYRQDCRALLWWCAFDQKQLTRPPYRWCAIERELGLFRVDGSLKPVGAELQKFQKRIQALPFAALPAIRRDAVVVLTDDASSWGAAWGAYLLAQRAGFEVEFCRAGMPLPEKALYLVPCLTGWDGIAQTLCEDLEARAKSGATVLYTYKDAMLSPFGAELGIEPLGHAAAPEAVQFSIGGKKLSIHAPARLRLAVTDAEVLLYDEQGEILCTRKAAGKGFMAFFALPLELEAVTRRGGAESGLEEIYRLFSDKITQNYPVRTYDSLCGVSFHMESPGAGWAFCFNRSEKARCCTYMLTAGWSSPEALPEWLDGHDFTLVRIRRNP